MAYENNCPHGFRRMFRGDHMTGDAINLSAMMRLQPHLVVIYVEL